MGANVPPTDSPRLLHLAELIESKRTLVLRADPNDPLYRELNRACAEQLDALLGMGAGSGSGERAQQLVVVRTPYGNLPVLAVPADPISPRDDSKPDSDADAPETIRFHRALVGLKSERYAYSEKNFGARAPWVRAAFQKLKAERREVEVWIGI